MKSLYTVIPNGDGLLALTHFLNKRQVLQPPTRTLVRLAELVLTLNTFSFNGNFYRQTGGVATGRSLRPNYACLFMGHIEEQIFEQYTGTKPALYKRYIDNIAGATSGSREEMEDFATYVNGFHLSLNFTWVISDVQLPFLDLCLKPASDGLLTSIHYKETDTHSVLPTSLTHHLILPVVRIPSLTVSFSVYNASVVRRMILKTRARKWQAFSEAVAIPQMLFSEPKNEYLLSLVTPLFQSVQM